MIESQKHVPLLKGYDESICLSANTYEASKEDWSAEMGKTMEFGQEEQESRPILETNRAKAVIAANIHHFSGFVYAVILKLVTTDYGVAVLDIRLMTNIIVLIGSFCLAKSQGVSLYVEKKDRCRLLLRCILDTAWQITFVFGLVMIPLVISSTILNTQPFWATIIGWSILGESMTRIEVLAMILSFSGVIGVAMSNEKKTSSDVEGEETSD